MKKLFFIGAMIAVFTTSCSTETVNEDLTLTDQVQFEVTSKSILTAGTATGS